MTLNILVLVNQKNNAKRIQINNKIKNIVISTGKPACPSRTLHNKTKQYIQNKINNKNIKKCSYKNIQFKIYKIVPSKKIGFH